MDFIDPTRIDPPRDDIQIAAHYGGTKAEKPAADFIITQLNFLVGVAAGDISHLVTSNATEMRKLDERQRLFEQGAPLTTIFLVLSGTLYQSRLTEVDGKQRMSLRTTLEPGKIAGLYDMLYRQPHSATVRAIEPCEVLAIDAAEIGRLLARYPNLRSQIVPMDRFARLRTIPFFEKQSETELSFIADACVTENRVKGETIYRSGDELEYFYIIHQGQVHMTAPGEADLWLGNGTVLGIGQPNAAPYGPALAKYTAKATAPTELLVVKRKILLDIVPIAPDLVGQEMRDEINDTIHRLAVFREYSKEERNRLMGYMSYFSVPDKRRLLMQQGEIGDSFWLLMPNRRATVAALNPTGQAIARTKLFGPIYFSELALRVQRPLKSTVDAEVDSQWLRLHWTDFRVFLKETNQNLARKLVLSEDVEKFLGNDSERKKYPWLQDGESLRLFCRRHWIALARGVVLPFFLTLVLLLLWLGVLMFSLFSALTQALVFGPFVLILVAMWAWFITDYMNDYLLVTNLRVMHQEKVVWVNETRKSASLSQVQNVDVSANFLGNILGFSDVTIQTSGATGAIEFDHVKNAEEIRTAISEMSGDQKNNKGAEGKILIQHVLEERLGLGLEIPSRVRVDADEVLNSGVDVSRLGKMLGISASEQSANWDTSQKIVWHKHWFILLKSIMPALLLFLTSLILLIATVVGALSIPFLGAISGFLVPALTIPAILVCLGGLAWAGWIWADWRNDTYTIDGDQVIDVEKTPLFTGEKTRSAKLGDIENVQLDIPSPIHYILNFGNVVLQTAAADGQFTFDAVPNPRAVAEEVRRRIQIYERNQEQKQARQNAKDLPDWFETYNRLDSNRAESERNMSIESI